MRLRMLPLALILTTLAACSIISTPPMMASRLSHITIGMGRANVLAVMGDPVSASNTGEIERLNYQLPETIKEAQSGITYRFVVRLKKGKVDAFGRPEEIEQEEKGDE